MEKFWSDGVDSFKNEVVEHQKEEPVKYNKQKSKIFQYFPFQI